MNGIQAIQDKFGDKDIDKGNIDIEIQRSEETLNITVSDNGIGLNDKNFQAFITPDTDYKISRGGKGVGRLTWLKTFNQTEVHSQFLVGSDIYRRSFLFMNSQEEAISNHTFEKTSQAEQTGTVVRLINMRSGYFQTFPSKGKTIATHIIRHFLPIFISEKCPKISLSENGSEIDLLTELNKNIDEKEEEIIYFGENNEKLKISHMRIKSHYAPKSTPSDMMKEGKPHNAVYYAADQRVGFEYSLDNQLGMTTFEGCKYVGILSGDFLDEHMNQERTYLDLPPDEVKTIKDAVYSSVTDFLSPFMELVKEQQNKAFHQIKKTFPTLTANAPEDYVKKLPFSIVLSEDMIANLAKHKSRSHSKNVNEEKRLESIAQQATQKDQKITLEQEKEIKETIEKLSHRLTVETNASLAEHMLRRKAVINLLDKYMGLDTDGKNFKEDLIHTLICPMHQIDNSKKLLDHNLWLLDDRFAFYAFLASDKALKQYTPSDALGRPDVLFVLDEQLAFDRLDGKQSPVFIVEFKRPSKVSYQTAEKMTWDTEDPFDRFLSYKETLHEGISKERTHDGRLIKIPKDRPVHCFLIADMTKNLENKCKQRLSPIEGSNSYFGNVPNIGFIHAISYDDLINNAKLRHEVFFKQLGIED